MPDTTYDEIAVPRRIPMTAAAQWIEDAAAEAGLRVGMRATLATRSHGNIHWHLKRGAEPGTLEMTLLNRERRIELSIRKNRSAPWAPLALEQLAAFLTARLSDVPLADSADP
jgi:hypothetical protein